MEEYEIPFCLDKIEQVDLLGEQYTINRETETRCSENDIQKPTEMKRVSP